MKKRRLIVLAVMLITFALLIAYQYVPPSEAPPPPAAYSADRALWVGITWVMDEHSEVEIAALAADLQSRNVNYAFVYVSYLKPGNFFNPTFDYAAEFVRRFRVHAPEITLLAWIGVPIRVTESTGEYSDNRLENPAVRDLIAQFSVQTVVDLGFEGVHLNIETVLDGDAAFLTTLDTVRAALPSDAVLSTTSNALKLTENVTAVPFVLYAALSPHHWSPDYLREVAVRVDQVAMMSYDSTLFFPRDYRSWMAFQTRSAAAALNGLDVHFLMGFPVSEEWTITHNIYSESLQNAMYGFRAGLAESETPQVIDGIAVYPYWEIDAAEWELLHRLP